MMAIDFRWYIIAGMVMVIIGLQMSRLRIQSELDSAKAEVLALTISNEAMNNAVVEQNRRIEAMKLDKEANERALEEWRSKKPEVRYKTVVEYVDIGAKSNECEDIKNMLDGIKRTSF